MLRPLHLIIACTTLCLPFLAHAEDIEIWNFANGGMPAQPSVQQLTNAQSTAEGIFISTSTDGFILWPDHPLPGPADVITVRARSTQPTEAALLWPADPDNPDELLQLFFVIEPSNGFRDVDIIVGNYSEWDWQTERFGIAFPAGTTVTIQEISFRHWAWSERLVEGWKSFWTFDEFRPYSINFLWGPLIATNEPARMQLFDSLPPTAWSALRLWYGVILVAGIGAMVYAMTAKDRHTARNQALVFFGATCVIAWVTLDLRMGMELMEYARRDIASYVHADADEKTLRTHMTFYAVADAFLPELTKANRYGLIPQEGSPFYANLRYMTYPSVPVTDLKPEEDLGIYAVIGRPDVSLDAENRLTDGNGNILTPPGTVLLRSGPDSFLFRTNQ